MSTENTSSVLFAKIQLRKEVRQTDVTALSPVFGSNILCQGCHLYRPGQLAPALTALSPTVSQCLMACKDSNQEGADTNNENFLVKL